MKRVTMLKVPKECEGLSNFGRGPGSCPVGFGPYRFAPTALPRGIFPRWYIPGWINIPKSGAPNRSRAKLSGEFPENLPGIHMPSREGGNSAGSGNRATIPGGAVFCCKFTHPGLSPRDVATSSTRVCAIGVLPRGVPPIRR